MTSLEQKTAALDLLYGFVQEEQPLANHFEAWLQERSSEEKTAIQVALADLMLRHGRRLILGLLNGTTLPAELVSQSHTLTFDDVKVT